MNLPEIVVYRLRNGMRRMGIGSHPYYPEREHLDE
jgi:hypothetical protein